MKKILAILIFVLLLLTIVYAQEIQFIPVKKDKDDKILLKSREISPEKGIPQTLKDKITARVPKKTHVLIQFNSIPSNEEKEELKNQGIELIAYIPNKAWFASVPSDFPDKITLFPNIRATVGIIKDDKISRAVKNKNYKKNGDGTVNLSIKFFDDVDLDTASAIIENHGQVIDKFYSVNIVKLVAEEIFISDIANEENVQWIDVIEKKLQTYNDGNRENIGVDTLQVSPYNLNGAGVVVAEWDSGWADITHDDLQGRVILGDNTTCGGGDSGTCGTASHSTHVAGTMLGNGTLSEAKGGTALQWRGMAPKATVVSYEWWDTSTELNFEYNDTINTYDASLSQNSWGYTYIGCGSDCNGGYDSFAGELDSIVRGSKGKKISQIWSAGNNRPSSCDSGSNDCISFPATAKNVITVGATNSNDDSITSFSSFGPTNDGRLKPEVTAPGCQSDGDGGVTSTIPTDTYDTFCGTSMAAPTTSGVVALMYEEFANKGTFPLPSTIKAILIHTSLELGNTGPDYSFGYGRIDALTAIDKIKNDTGSNDVIIEESISNAETIEFDMTVASTVKVTLVWDDPAAAANADPTLVNDLDLVLVAPNSTVYSPWVLDPANPEDLATKGTNTIDNVEQVFVENALSGIWTVRITGTSVPTEPQNFSLVSDHSFTVQPSVDVKTFRDSYTTEDKFFDNAQEVFIQANVTAGGVPLESNTVTADLILSSGVIEETLTLNEVGNGLYRNSWDSTAHTNDVYLVNVTATGNGTAKNNNNFHLYPGSGVSAYLMDWDNDDHKDYVLENVHLISVYNGLNATDQSLLYLEQKDTNVSYDFASISDNDTIGRGEITTTNLKEIIFSSLAFTQTGESLSTTNLQMDVELSDPTETLITFYDTTNGASADANFFVDDDQWLAQQFDSTDLDQDYNLTKVSVFVGKGDRASNPLIVEIRTDNGGVPSSTVLTSESVPESSVPTSSSFINVSFTTSITLEQGGLYWLVLRNIDTRPKNPNDPNFAYTWSGDTTAPTYPGAFTFTQDQGTTWFSENIDQLFRAWGSPVAITTFFNLSIDMSSEDVDYLLYTLNNFDSNTANMNDLFAPITGSFGSDADDRYHLQSGEDDLITSLTSNQWNNFNSNYSLVYDNSTISDSVNENVLAFVRFNETNGVVFQDIGLWSGSEGARIRYNVTQATTSDEINYILAFTQGDFQTIDQWMPTIASNQLPSPNFLTAPSGELISITLLGFPVDFGNLNTNTINSSAIGNANNSYIIQIDPVTTVNVDIFKKGDNFTSGASILDIQNVIYDDDNVTEGSLDITNPETILTSTYDTTPYFSNISAGTNKSIYYFISIPENQQAGDYSTTFFIKAVETETIETTTTREFNISAFSFGFVPSSIIVNEGDTVRLNVNNTAGTTHTFNIDEFDVHTGNLPTGTVVTEEFVANQTGTFFYYCDIGQHRQNGMEGNLTVNP